MSAQPIYRNYDQAALDAQYNARAMVPDHETLIAGWTRDSIAARHALEVRRDIAYGPSSEETLDIFPGQGASGPAPLHVFYHGGYWRAFHKDDFSYVARAIVPKGGTVVVVNYALVPSVRIGELVRQCRAAFAWVWRNAASFGGDAGRITLSGHSAGAHLVAMMMATDWPAFDGVPADVIKGATAISGIYDLEPVRLCYINADLKLSPEEMAPMSPLRLAPRGGAPLTVVYGAEESEEFRHNGQALAEAWTTKGIECRLIEMPGLNHFSILEELKGPETTLARAIHRQIGIG